MTDDVPAGDPVQVDVSLPQYRAPEIKIIEIQAAITNGNLFSVIDFNSNFAS